MLGANDEMNKSSVNPEVTEEVIERAQAAWLSAKQARDGQPTRMRAALAAVAPDIAAQAYDRGRDDGAAEERERIAAAMDRKAELADARSESVQGHLRTVVVSEAQTLRWASSYARKKPS